MYIYIYGFMCFEGLRLMGRLFGSRTCSRSLKALIFWDFCLSPQMEKKFHGFIILNSYICDLGPGFIPVNQLFLSHSMSMSSDNQGCGKPSLSLSPSQTHTIYELDFAWNNSKPFVKNANKHNQKMPFWVCRKMLHLFLCWPWALVFSLSQKASGGDLM